VHVLPHGLVEVVVPRRTKPEDVEAFVAASRDWIDRTLSRINRNGPAASLALPDEIELAAKGCRWSVVYSGDGTGTGVTRFGEHGGRLAVSACDPEARRTLRDWLLSEGRRELPARVARIADEIGLRPDSVSIRRQRTRWGSCSPRRRINLNCALLFLPSDLVDYLIVHELCHLRHMNHSRRFWALVRSFRPDSAARERALSRAWTRVPGWVFYDA
jgi:predicted metal-dependent hydrolase